MKKTLMAAATTALMGLSAPALAETWKPQDGDALYFGIYTEGGERFGTYAARFEREDGNLIVHRSQNMSVTRMYMTVFNMDQRAKAVFSRKGLESLENRLDIQSPVGGQNRSLDVTREGRSLKARNNNGETHELPSNAWPIMFWHRSIIKRENLFDMATGETRPFIVTRRGFETVEANGEEIECEAYAINTLNEEGKDAAFVVWYEENSKFCRMEFDTPMGKAIFKRESEGSFDDGGEEESPV
ncbi:MAG: DUF6134 family protein [Alphaproteobacteria bacterium]